ncbi:MAG: glycosyltransferase [Candidatus Pristimantibacillus sp.]
MTLSVKSSNNRGKEEGFAAGYDAGWRVGACEAVRQTNGNPKPVITPLRILYVPQGFEAIDSGIIDSLRACVVELHIANPQELVQQAISLRPDLVLVLNGLHTFPEDHLQQLDAIRMEGIRTAVWYVDDPYMTEASAKNATHYDIVITHELSTVALYKELGCQIVHYCPLAVNEKIFRPMQTAPEYRSDICFIGQGFWNRIAMFDAIADTLIGKRVVIIGQLWERLQQYSHLKPFINMDWIDSEECVKYYNAAKIVINMHRTTEAGSDNFNSYQYPGYSINPRTFEIAACASFQLTDVRQDLKQYYQPGYDLETYRDANELSAKLTYYLSHEEERRYVALRGYYRTMRDHKFTARMTQLLQMLIEE